MLSFNQAYARLNRVSLLGDWSLLTSRTPSSTVSGSTLPIAILIYETQGLTAAVLFDIVLGTFTQWQTLCGKLVGMLYASCLFVCSDGLCCRSQFWMRRTSISSTAMHPG